MKFFTNKIKYNKGYAILFTIVVVGIISMITIGLSNALFKQVVLSSVAKDSTKAFYQAEFASECALLFDNEMDIASRGNSGTFKCADKNLPYIVDTSNSSLYTILINPLNEDSLDKCIRIDIAIDNTKSPIFTRVNAKGYNICKKDLLRTVERTLQVTY